MKSKRILSALLAALMIVTAVLSTGCSNQSNNDENELSGIITLNMFVLTEEETDPAAARAVQMAINEITVPQHKMLVKINYLTADEYWDAIDAAETDVIRYLEERQAAKSDKTAAAAASNDNEEAPVKKNVSQMSFNEAIDYVFDIEDIELENPQLDILVVDDYAKFLELVEDERLATIDTKYDRKVLTKYIHPTILSTATIDGKVYGVPTNFAMNGKYEFLVFNKTLLDKYGYTVHDLRKVEEMGEYFAKIKANEPGYYPINELPELSGAEIYDDILFSLSTLTSVSDSSYPVYLNNSVYMNYLKTMASYRENGYVAANDGVKNMPYAVEYVTSDSLIEREWTENGTTYQAYLYDIPRVTSADAFRSAMCVSNYSLNKAKAAELIELFTIDADLANLLQYGIEGVNYRVEDGIVTFIETEPEDTYRMDNFVTGNTYIKYATEETADYVEAAKNSNLSVAPSAYFGYTLKFDDVSSESVYDCVKEFSAAALEMLANGELSVDDVFNIASRQLNALGCQWDASGSVLLGMFGKLAAQQKNSAKQNTAYFTLSEEAKVYNDVYKSAEEVAAELAAAEAEREAEEAARRAEAEAELDAQIEAENQANQAAENNEDENGEADNGDELSIDLQIEE